MLAGLVLLEALSILLFAALLVRQQTKEVHQRMVQGAEHQVTSMALQAKEALLENQPGWVGLSVKMAGESPSVARALVTDPAGNVLFVSEGVPEQVKLNPLERAQIPLMTKDEPRVFTLGNDRWEAACPIYTGSELRGFAWIERERAWDYQQLNAILRDTAIFGVIWIVASALLVLLMAGSISRPLATLHRGTRALMNSPENSGSFPLPVVVHNEIGDLIEAFNRMVASIAEQRAGLNDTLSLLDSMLANAPIGLAFFDRRCRFVRVNRVFADMAGVPLSRHLGRTLLELLPQPVAQELENTVLRVFAEEQAVRNLELTTPAITTPAMTTPALTDTAVNGQRAKPARSSTWLASAYPVRTTPQEVRWVGVIVLDASERKRSEEALRKTEKLAATGRLAASISHEINNPLEAITNLLFLLRNFCQLEDPALNYVVMAEHEARRISEITQQTLRFYRQPTQPARANVGELLDSVISLYQGRLKSFNIQVERKFDPNVDLFCFAGELRQVFANLIGNAIDASSDGGRLLVRARRSRSWKNSEQTGIRFAVADTGTGMEPAVLERIFEAFFTTKSVTGTGLGLWVSQEIVEKHGGLIHVRSRTAALGAQSGTVFELFIPDDANLTAVSVNSAASRPVPT
jgi:signal transduction histidine kinase/HAMP domain-containing protein